MLRLVKKRFQSQKRHQIGSISGNSAYIFACGCYRSGTTVLNKALSQSEEIKFFSDGNQEAFNNYYLRDFLTLAKLQKQYPGTNLLFQTNNECFKVEDFLKYFPNAKGLLIYRHYNDVIDSTIRNKWQWVKGQVIFNLLYLLKIGAVNNSDEILHYLKLRKIDDKLLLEPGFWKQNSNSIPILKEEGGEAIVFGLYWLILHENFLLKKFNANPEIYIVKYETLLVNPEEKFKNICKFIGIEFNSAIPSQIEIKSEKEKGDKNLLPHDLRNRCEKVYQALNEIP